MSNPAGVVRLEDDCAVRCSALAGPDAVGGKPLELAARPLDHLLEIGNERRVNGVVGGPESIECGRTRPVNDLEHAQLPRLKFARHGRGLAEPYRRQTRSHRGGGRTRNWNVLIGRRPSLVGKVSV